MHFNVRLPLLYDLSPIDILILFVLLKLTTNFADMSYGTYPSFDDRTSPKTS